MPDNLRMAPDAVRAAILRDIRARPGISQREIMENIGLSRDTIGYQLSVLLKEGRIEKMRKGRFVVYYPRRGP